MDAEKIVKVAKLISYNFLSVLISKKSLTQLGDFYPHVESRILAKEWFCLQIYLMVIAISSFYKDKAEGIEITKLFRKLSIEGLVEAGVYSSEEEAKDFIKPRIESYGLIGDKDNYIKEISIKFLKYLEQKDMLLLLNTGAQIGTLLEADMKLVKEAHKISA